MWKVRIDDDPCEYTVSITRGNRLLHVPFKPRGTVAFEWYAEIKRDGMRIDAYPCTKTQSVRSLLRLTGLLP